LSFDFLVSERTFAVFETSLVAIFIIRKTHKYFPPLTVKIVSQIIRLQKSKSKYMGDNLFDLWGEQIGVK
jgi:hypothetical protein